MGNYLDTLSLIVHMATRNLFASRLKTLIVGGIILFGSMLVVVGTALVDSVDATMSRSIVGSVAGHIQVYNADSRDDLVVMGDLGSEEPDLAQIDEFRTLSSVIVPLPNIKAVVPMGLSGALVLSGNTVDVVLAKLRDLVRRRQAGENVTADIESQKDHVRQIANVVSADLANIRQILTDRAVAPEDLAAVQRAAQPEFWAEFDRDPFTALEYLENRIAPAASDSELVFLRYLGTDVSAFQQSFDRMKIVDGQTVPRGRRGFLFSKWTYEHEVKMKTAQGLDEIHDAIVKRGRTIAADPDLQRWIKHSSTEVKEIMLQLDGRQVAEFRAKLQRELRSHEDDVSSLLSEMFRVNDDNFMRRYRFFYDQLAPSLALYRVRVGDTLTVKAFTRGGYVQAVNLRVYGTFAFEGLEDSNLAGGLNLMDMVSFRELYGFSTPERAREFQAIKATAGLKDIDRDNAEAELFGAKQADSLTPAAGRQATATGTVDALLRGLGSGKHEDREDQPYDPTQLSEGAVLNAAIIVKNPQRIPQTMQEIEAAGSKAGLHLKVIDWQKASGLVGQFVMLLRAVLYTSVLIIFAVALVIISNAMVMATMERIAEIGTLRAVGAQRSFLLGMLLVEALAIGALFGSLGAALGACIVVILHMIGIPAGNDVIYFLFSGPRLYPELSVTNIAIALSIVFLVSGISGIYPGFLAMRVNPRQAMQSDE